MLDEVEVEVEFMVVEHDNIDDETLDKTQLHIEADEVEVIIDELLENESNEYW